MSTRVTRLRRTKRNNCMKKEQKVLLTNPMFFLLSLFGWSQRRKWRGGGRGLEHQISCNFRKRSFNSISINMFSDVSRCMHVNMRCTLLFNIALAALFKPMEFCSVYWRYSSFCNFVYSSMFF
jgi:hypothetical protein